MNASITRRLTVWDDRDHDFIAGDVRIQQSIFTDSAGILAESELTLTWEDAWELFDSLRYLLHDDEVRQSMLDNGFEPHKALG